MAKLRTCKAPTCSARKPQDEMIVVGLSKWVCDYQCGADLAMHLRERERERKRQKESRELRKRKEALKSRGDWMREAQAAFNSYIRARDYGKPCISCGVMEQSRFTGGHFDCGHYRSRGAASHLRFNVYNAHGQCKRCNRELSGNAVEYRIGLVRRIGERALSELENDNTSRSFNIHYLRRLKAIFSRRARHIKKLRGIE